jgi:arginase
MMIVAFHMVPMSFDANARGTQRAPEYLLPVFEERYDLECVRDVRSVANATAADGIRTCFAACSTLLARNCLPMTIGGDRSVAIGSVFASNEYSATHNHTLGVLWLGARADFHTYESSTTKNVNGMSAAVLCGHTLPELQVATALHPTQFAFYGVRNVDEAEQERLVAHDVRPLVTEEDLLAWMQHFDVLHVSFDVGILDSKYVSSVSTPVEGGCGVDGLQRTLATLNDCGRVISMDVVELNPDRGDVIASLVSICDAFDAFFCVLR